MTNGSIFPGGVFGAGRVDNAVEADEVDEQGATKHRASQRPASGSVDYYNYLLSFLGVVDVVDSLKIVLATGSPPARPASGRA